MSRTNIIIISDPVRSGKTTRLAKWAATQENLFVLLMPDLGSKRGLYISSLNCVLPLEVYAKDYLEEDLFFIGRFSFLKESFLLAQEKLLEVFATAQDHILIDEVGKLEMKQQQGFEPSLAKILMHQQNSLDQRKVYVVVRNYLLEEAKFHYQIGQSKVISSVLLNQESGGVPMDFCMLLLCGGQGRRMNKPKALLNYHGLPQYLWLNQLANACVDKVIISCKKEQANWFDPSLAQIHDHLIYEDAGPLGGLLSLLDKDIKQAIMIVGCDYPQLTQEHLQMLKDGCNTFSSSVALSKGVNEPLEPMLCCIHPKDFKTIQNLYQEQQIRSLQKILEIINAIKIVVEQPASIKSYDTPEDFESFRPIF
jgi:molybdenum cofactor guanylyltransferase